MLPDLLNLSTNQDLIMVGGGYFILKTIGVFDLVRRTMQGKNSNGRPSESDSKEQSRRFIEEIHDMTEKQQDASQKVTDSLLEMVVLTRSMDSSMRELLTLRRDGR